MVYYYLGKLLVFCVSGIFYLPRWIVRTIASFIFTPRGDRRPDDVKDTSAYQDLRGGGFVTIKTGKHAFLHEVGSRGGS